MQNLNIKPWQKIVLFVVLAAACCAGFLYVYDQVFAPVIAKGVGPGAANQPTAAGWLTLVLTGVGTLGFTKNALWSIGSQILQQFIKDKLQIDQPQPGPLPGPGPNPPSPPPLPSPGPSPAPEPDQQDPQTTVAELLELDIAFRAMMSNPNRAAERRFIFALIDASPRLKGIEVTHENGVIVLKYSGFVDPVPPLAEAWTKSTLPAGTMYLNNPGVMPSATKGGA